VGFIVLAKKKESIVDHFCEISAVPKLSIGLSFTSGITYEITSGTTIGTLLGIFSTVMSRSSANESF